MIFPYRVFRDLPGADMKRKFAIRWRIDGAQLLKIIRVNPMFLFAGVVGTVADFRVTHGHQFFNRTSAQSLTRLCDWRQ